MGTYLEKLQNADDRTKWRYGTAITTVVMVLVIYIWLAYFNTLVAPQTTATNAEVGDEGFSFWETTKQETASMYNGFKEQISNFKTMIEMPKEYEIKPGQ